MTEHDLKEMKNLGAELGAAKAELERLSHKLERARDHLTHARHDVEIRANAGNDAARLVLKGIDQWLSDYDQSPDDTYTAVDMATAAAQGFRDGQAAVEPAAAQDEQPAVFWVLFDATGPERFIKKDVSDGTLAFFDSEDEAQRAKRSHPGTDYKRVEYYRAPIAQTALSAVTAERDRLLEELAATNRGINAKLPRRKFAAVGTGALYAEQNYCYRRGWKEGVAALRAQIRAAAMAAKEA